MYQHPPGISPDPDVVMEGYLYKRSSNAFKTWNRRWFQIKDNKFVGVILFSVDLQKNVFSLDVHASDRRRFADGNGGKSDVVFGPTRASIG